MPTARQTDGKLPGRTALLTMLKDEDKQKFFEYLLSAAVLKDDLVEQDAESRNAAPGTHSLPGARELLLTNEGGYAIRLIADEPMAKGTVVTAGDAAYSSCRAHIASSKEPPIGVIYEGVSQGDLATVVVAGMARVLVVPPD